MTPDLLITGQWDQETEKATRLFQSFYGLSPTGKLDNKSLAEATRQGFPGGSLIASEKGIVPPPPSGYRPLSAAESSALFGKFSFTPAPTESNPEAIRVDPTWVKENIVAVPRPACLSHVKGMGAKLHFHREVVDPFLNLVAAWEKAGLTHLIETWGGDWVPRFVRGSRTTLSNHSMGSAFDVNPIRNGLGTLGAPVGSPQSVRLLVPLAFDHGWWWGGWWGYKGADDIGEASSLAGRPDPMHFQYGIKSLLIPLFLFFL